VVVVVEVEGLVLGKKLRREEMVSARLVHELLGEQEKRELGPKEIL
jgi:hypothetical protein